MQPQVLHDYRPAGGIRVPGEQPTLKDMQAWEAALDHFFRPGPGCAVEGATQGKKLRKAPRVVTLEYINAVDNALYAGLNKRLHDFAEDATFLETPVVLASKQGAGTDIPMPMPTKFPATLTICSDEGLPQTAMIYFLYYEMRLNIIALKDPAHRCWNDVSNALKACNLYSTVITSALVFNLHYGPWKGAGWFSQIIDAAADMVNVLSPSDRLLMSVWDSICADRGWHCSHEKGLGARRSFLAGLQDVRAVTNKGPQVAGSRWFSWMHAAAFWDQEWHTKLLLLLFICIQNGVLNSRSTLFRKPTKEPVPDDAPGHDLQPGPAMPTSSKAASSSSGQLGHGAPGAAASSQQTLVPAAAAAAAEYGTREGTAMDSMAAAAESLAEKRERCKSTLHLALSLLYDSDLLWRVGLIMWTCQPITAMHTEYSGDLTSPSKVLSCYVRWATWQWLPVLHKVAGTMSDAARLERIGFKVSFGHGTADTEKARLRALHEDACARELARLVFNLVKHRASSMMFYSASYPGRLAAILAEDPVVSKAALDRLRLDADAYVAAKGQANTMVQRFVSRCVLGWPIMLVVVHIARSADWELVPELRLYLLDIFEGFGNSVIIEKAFHHARDEETRCQSSKQMAMLRRWSVPVRHEVLAEFGREEVQPTTTLPVPASVPKKLFKAMPICEAM